ncbi:MAG: TolC family outer membrane protein [Proteobacteria bacterium]|nr:TolC family outer membrane protein [Pseudomonadota bacterium]
MINFTKLRVLLSVLALFCLFNAPVRALDLSQAYEHARNYDADYMTAISSYEAARLDLPLAESANRPGLTAALGAQHNDDTLNLRAGPTSSADYEQGQLSLDLNQNLYDRSIRYDIDAAGYAVDIAELQLGIAKEELIVTTVENYLNVLSALDNENLAELERTAIEKQLDLATQRLNVGLGTKTDQYDAQARFEGANAELIAAQNEVVNTQQALEAVMGQLFQSSPKQEMRTLDNDKVTLDLVEGEEWVETVLLRNRAYRIKQKQTNIQEVEVARSADARIPSIGLTAGARATDSNGGLASDGSAGQYWTVGVQASMPIYLGGSIKLRQTKAGHAYNSASYEAEQSRRDTDRMIRAARRGVQALQRQVEALKQAVIAGKSALESKEEGFKAGVTTNLIVLDAQRDLFRDGRDYLRASYDLVNAIVVLERAAGQLDEEDVKRINSWLK